VALWRASLENTSVPGGPLALQIRPRVDYDVVSIYDDPADTLTYGLPKVVNWRTPVIAIREAEVAPSAPASPGFLARPVLGVVTPPWAQNRLCTLVSLRGTGESRADSGFTTNVYQGEPTVPGVRGAGSILPGERATSGRTPNGTLCGGPVFSSQPTLPAFGGAVHRVFSARIVLREPMLVYGSGTHSFETDGPVIPSPGGVLYCASAVSTSPQTYYGAVIFEEL
jgi:hypothetical protein